MSMSSDSGASAGASLEAPPAQQLEAQQFGLQHTGRQPRTLQRKYFGEAKILRPPQQGSQHDDPQQELSQPQVLSQQELQQELRQPPSSLSNRPTRFLQQAGLQQEVSQPHALQPLSQQFDSQPQVSAQQPLSQQELQQE